MLQATLTVGILIPLTVIGPAHAKPATPAPAAAPAASPPATVPAAAAPAAPAPWTPQPMTITEPGRAKLREVTSAVSQDRLMALLGKLPPQRSAGPTPEHADRLAATQELLAAELKAIGVEFTTDKVPLRRGWTAKREPAKAPSSATDGSKNAEKSTAPAKDKDAEKAKDKDQDAGKDTKADPQKNAAAPRADQSHEWINIIVDLPGTTKRQEVLIIGAHFDSVPDSPGADDNGTGTAAAIELVRVLHQLPRQRTIRIILFNHEEIGLHGSAKYALQWRASHGPAADPPKPGEIREKLIGMVSLEMLGFYSDAPNSQKNPFAGMPGMPQLTAGDFLAICGTSKHRPFNRAFSSAMLTAEPAVKTVLIDQFPNEQMAFVPPDLLRSDHAPFLNMDLPALMLTDTANFRNPNYHKPTDTVATIDAARYTAAVRAVAGAAWLLAGGAEK